MQRTRNKSWALRAISTALLCLASFLALAQQPTEYIVELVVFQNLDPNAANTEHWPEDPGFPTVETAIDLSEASLFNPGFELQHPQEHRMTGAAARLNQSGRYRVLLHLSWKQPALSENEAQSVHIKSVPQNTGGVIIDGTVRLYRARYLHLSADLILFPEFDLSNLFRLQQSRRMRSNELHYLDHPVFGILAQVTPVEDSATAIPLLPAGGESAGVEATEDEPATSQDTE